MQDTLVPILGENGAIIAQYVITLAVILGLIALVIWAIRRYGGGGARPAARARLPRLAIVDTLAIDNKRRLVLVRRDSVEHLVLIGGPSDVVVEPSIVRQRVAQRPVAAATPTRPQPAGAAPQPPPPPPAPAPRASMPAAPRVLPSNTPLADAESIETPIPFPPRRTPLRASERLGLSRRETTRSATAGSAMAASAVAASEPMVEPVVARRMAMPAVEEEEQPSFAALEPVSAPFAQPVHPALDEASEQPLSAYPHHAADVRETASAFAPPVSDRLEVMEPTAVETNGLGEPVEMPAAPPTAAIEPPEGATQPAEVSDLEKEMARLLDEISTNRRE